MSSKETPQTEVEWALAYLEAAKEIKVDRQELAWVTIAYAQTHATLALVEAVNELTEITKVHR